MTGWLGRYLGEEMRIPRILSYVIYVIAFSFFLPLSALLIDKITAFMCCPTSLIEHLYAAREFQLHQGVLMVLPYVICHVMAAALTVRALSLRKLFYLSCVFAIIGQLFSYLTDDVWKVSVQLHTVCLMIGPLLPYLTPVLILALINRKKIVPKPISSSDMEMISALADSEAATAHRTKSKLVRLFRRYWYVTDIVLIFLVLLYGTLFDPFGLIMYRRALDNEMGALFTMTFTMILLFVPASLSLLTVALRMSLSWPERIKNKRRLLLLRVLVIVCLGGYLMIPFTPIKPPGYRTYSKGFSKYVKANADIEAIRDWLGILKPEDCVEYHIVNVDGSRRSRPRQLEEPEWPDVIDDLEPRYVTLSVDDDKQPKVRLTWGSGLLGSWGLAVGNEEMPTPESDLSRHGEYRQEIRQGAYVWFGIE